MRNALSLLFFIAALALSGCGGGGDASSSLRLPCPGGQAFCVSECDLVVTGGGFSITEIAENQRIRFLFSDEVDPQTVNGASISIRTATGVAPQPSLGPWDRVLQPADSRLELVELL